MSKKEYTVESCLHRILVINDAMMKFIEENPDDEELVYDWLDHLENLLDDGDYDDRFGTEGWRHTLLGEDE